MYGIKTQGTYTFGDHIRLPAVTYTHSVITYQPCGLDRKKHLRFRSVLIRMFTNFGRDIVFSADLCYNETNEKPPSEREGDRVSGGRSLRYFEFVLIPL